MIIPEPEEKPTNVKSPLRDEGSSLPDQVRQANTDPCPIEFHSLAFISPYAVQSPPPYSPLPLGGSSTKPPSPPNLTPDLAPTNYIHVKERDSSIKRKILLDLSVPRPPASALPPPAEAQGEDIPNLILDSHNGAVYGEVWLLSTNREDTAASSREQDRKPERARERVHLRFHSHNGAVKALVVRVLALQNPRRVSPPFTDYFR